ncbi:Domain of uncharacterised function (DUF2825) [Escherichia coli]|nr:Domain of uncharacterised function (DUF2825) [Escherichia coli]
MISIIASSAPGLSPLARGTLTRCYPVPFFQRFIPAGAGNTAADSRADHHRPVYPRWRGEHADYNEGRTRIIGLSPLARGTPYSFRTLHEICRFIPAGAGNTPSRSRVSVMKTVYPRWRGEHERVPCLGSYDGGLSPLARGTRGCLGGICCVSRFIPAGAGNTHFIMNGGNIVAVYPRWRGEHSFQFS